MIVLKRNDLVRLAGEHGKNIVDELSIWLKNERAGDEEKIIRELDCLKFSGLSLEVYSHYLAIYNTILACYSPKKMSLENSLRDIPDL